MLMCSLNVQVFVLEEVSLQVISPVGHGFTSLLTAAERVIRIRGEGRQAHPSCLCHSHTYGQTPVFLHSAWAKGDVREETSPPATKVEGDMKKR